ncbi:hypothetical protein GCM10009860_08030 [Microbacterium mitrae]
MKMLRSHDFTAIWLHCHEEYQTYAAVTNAATASGAIHGEARLIVVLALLREGADRGALSVAVMGEI